jgi:hypothetical protein
VMKRFAVAGFRLYTGAFDDSDGAGRLGGLTVALIDSIAGSGSLVEVAAFLILDGDYMLEN